MASFIGLTKEIDGRKMFAAAYTDDDQVLKRFKDGDEVLVEVKKPRNLKFHKKFFKLLQTIFHYMEDDAKLQLDIHDQKTLLVRLKLDMGLFDICVVGAGSVLPEGTVVYTPQSISFAAMDDTEFEKLYKGTIDVAIQKYIPAQDENALLNILRYDD